MAKITFFDDFAGTVLNPANWTFGLPGDPQGATWGSSDEWFPQNAVVNDNLYLVCNKNTAANGYPPNSPAKYACSIISTFGKFAYNGGWLKARLLMPNNAVGAAKGMWLGFWLLPNSYPNSGKVQNWEVDFEYLGVGDEVYCTMHKAGKQVAQFTVQSGWLSNNYNDFAFYWGQGVFQFWFNGNFVGEVSGDNVPDEPMFALLNTNTGGWNGNAVDGLTIFPNEMVCSYVMSWTE